MKRLSSLPRILLLLVIALGATTSSRASQAGAEMNAADEKLNTVFRAVKATLSEADATLLVAAQRAWIKQRDADVEFFAKHYPNSKGGLFLRIRFTNERTAYLQSILAAPAADNPEGGDYQYGVQE